MLPEIDSYDWEEAFKYAKDPEVVIGSTCSNLAFYRENVEKIIFISEGTRDEDSWIGVFQLDDGRFACLRAWCDYTGWG